MDWTDELIYDMELLSVVHFGSFVDVCSVYTFSCFCSFT